LTKSTIRFYFIHSCVMRVFVPVYNGRWLYTWLYTVNAYQRQ